MKNVLFPPGGINHIVSDISDLFDSRIEDAKEIVVNCSAQPNSIPHLGTVTTVMCSFALASHLKARYQKDSYVLFDILENSPGRQIEKDGVLYSLSLEDTIVAGVSKYKQYLPFYEDLFLQISSLSGVPFIFRSFREYQRLPEVRRYILEILKNASKLEKLLEPKGGPLHVRIPCPVCRYVDKKCVTTQFANELITSVCHEHGTFSVNLEQECTYVDFNAQLRDLIKGLYIKDEVAAGIKYTIMCDGGDWAGVWALKVHCEAMNVLGYDYHTPRVFCPVITDWSGAKFSKSLYVKDGSYDDLPLGLKDYQTFMSCYGDDGIKKLWIEVKSWLENPLKFFRNYSIEYILCIMEGELHT